APAELRVFDRLGAGHRGDLDELTVDELQHVAIDHVEAMRQGRRLRDVTLNVGHRHVPAEMDLAHAVELGRSIADVHVHQAGADAGADHRGDAGGLCFVGEVEHLESRLGVVADVDVVAPGRDRCFQDRDAESEIGATKVRTTSTSRNAPASCWSSVASIRAAVTLALPMLACRRFAASRLISPTTTASTCGDLARSATARAPSCPAPPNAITLMASTLITT